MRLPIFQFVIGINSEGEEGLLFSSELEGDESQSICFAVPVPRNITHPFEVQDFLYHSNFYFPFVFDRVEDNGEILELEPEVDFPELIFRVPRFEKEIIFNFDVFPSEFEWEWRFGRRKFSKYFPKYVGNSLLSKSQPCVFLSTEDVFLMNDLYEQQGGVFVGLTTNFGNQIDGRLEI